MSNVTHNRRRGGAAGMVVLFSLAALGAGLGFDFAARQSAFWIGAEPGGAAAIGAGAVAFVVLAGRLIRLVFAVRPGAESERADKP